MTYYSGRYRHPPRRCFTPLRLRFSRARRRLTACKASTKGWPTYYSPSASPAPALNRPREVGTLVVIGMWYKAPNWVQCRRRGLRHAGSGVRSRYVGNITEDAVFGTCRELGRAGSRGARRCHGLLRRLWVRAWRQAERAGSQRRLRRPRSSLDKRLSVPFGGFGSLRCPFRRLCSLLRL